VTVNRQVELSEPIANGLVKREAVHELGDIVAGKVTLKRDPGGIVFYKNNTGLAMQFAACGAILHRKLLAEGTNRTIPTEWFAGAKPHI
jgi:ornithine cyclodeaminase/alanine dehydrogenase-like protein (mu-crystallin family)